MKNVEKYKAAEERFKAFSDFCVGNIDFSKCKNCIIKKNCDCYPSRGICFWLDLDAEEENPLPCPFCGSEVLPYHHWNGMHNCQCTAEKCWYSSELQDCEEEAIAAHNRVAKAVMESEAK